MEGLSPELQSALATLSAGEREVIALRIVIELDGEQTARVLGISPTAVSTRLSRALTKLEEKVRTMTSADLITELQAARPTADSALRDRVRTIATTRAGPPALALRTADAPLAEALRPRRRAGDGGRAARARRRHRPARLRLAAADRHRRRRELPRQRRPRPPPRRTRRRPQSKAGAAAGADATAPIAAPDAGPRPALLGPADAVGEGRRRALGRDPAGTPDHARPRRLPRHRLVRDLGHRCLVADAEGADRERAGRDRPADRASARSSRSRCRSTTCRARSTS